MSAVSTPGYAHPQGALETVVGYGITRAYGATVPTDGAAGFATGCIFHQVDGGVGTALYINEGDETSADFNPVVLIPAAGVNQTAISDITVTGTYTDDDDAIELAVNSILAALRTAGIIASS